MTLEQLLVFAILIFTLVLFLWDRWRYDLVAMLALGLSVAVGVVDYNEAFSGFSEPVVITVAAILVMSAALNRSGFIDFILKKMSGFLGKPYQQVFLLCAMVMVLSAFMNNIGALAVFLPVALSIARQSGRSASELLMPLSFASLLGGLVTLIGTPPNLLISAIRRRYTEVPFEMFDFAPVGLGLCAAGLLYLTFAWHLIPRGRKGKPLAEDKFIIEDYLSEVKVKDSSLVTGKRVREIETNFEDAFDIVGLVHDGRYIVAPGPNKIVRSEDTLVVRGDPATIKKLVTNGKVILKANEKKDDEPPVPFEDDEDSCVMEAVIMSGSELNGRTVREVDLRRRFGLNLLAVQQNDQTRPNQFKNLRLRVGDVIALQGSCGVISETLRELHCLPLAERNLMLGRKYFAILPVIIVAAAVLMTVLDIVPVAIAFAGAVLAIALLKILRMDEIYEAVNWPIIILLGALLPITDAFQETGGHELVADLLLPLANQLPGWGLIALVLIASMAVTPFLNNAAAVLVMAPVAVSLALKMDMNIDPFLMAVAVGTSCDFLTPIGHQSNTLVLGPGGYKFSDYFRLGFPLTLLVIFAGVPLIMFFWPV